MKSKTDTITASATLHKSNPSPLTNLYSFCGPGQKEAQSSDRLYHLWSVERCGTCKEESTEHKDGARDEPPVPLYNLLLEGNACIKQGKSAWGAHDEQTALFSEAYAESHASGLEGRSEDNHRGETEDGRAVSE